MPLSRFIASAALLLAASVATAQTPTTIWQDEIRREDLGTARREKLTQMELKAAPADLFSTLTEWAGGPAVTSDSTKGKVVLVMTLSSWEPSNLKALERAAKLADAAADKGLVFIVAHPAKLWDGAVKLFKERAVKGVLAQDDGKLRAKLLSDADPDFYIIDRAGQLRFADVETDSINKGVELALAETPESAASQVDLIKKQIVDARRKFDEPIPAGNIPAPGKRPKVTFKLPDSGVYEKAAWSEKNTIQESIGANDVQGQRLPNADSFGQKEIWFTDKPDWNGKILILHFWATWTTAGNRSLAGLQDLITHHGDDLCIIGYSGQDDDYKSVERFLRSTKLLPWYHCFDDKQVLAKALGVRLIPNVVVISTDGVVRWQGNPTDYRFRRVVELTMEIDPGVQARRAAEAAAQGAPGGEPAPAGK